MNRLKYTLCLTVIFLSSVVHGQDPEIIPLRIKENLFVLYGGNGQGANVGLFIDEDELVLIDAMRKETSERLIRTIREISDKPVGYVINTHADFDHTEGNSFFRAQGATIIAQENVQFEGSEADVYFDQKLTLIMSDERIELYSVTSHAFSDVLIYFKKSNVLFMGDTFTNSWYATFNSGGLAGQLSCLDLALRLGNDQTVIVPGHGILDNKSGIINYRETSIRWVSQVRKLHDSGSPIEEILENEELNQIKDRFIHPSTGRTIPKKRLKRFIERTISSELQKSVKADSESLRLLCGFYTYDSTETEEIFIKGNRLFIRKVKPYLHVSELIPLGDMLFHLKGGIDFNIRFREEQGQILGFDFISGEKTEFASKVNTAD